MSTEILMPALSPTMTEGNLTKWLVKEGQEIKAGDVIAEIETDKATMEVETVDEGFIEKLLYKEGDNNIPVNKPIALISAAKNSSTQKMDQNIEDSSKIENQEKEGDIATDSEDEKADTYYPKSDLKYIFTGEGLRFKDYFKCSKKKEFWLLFQQEVGQKELKIKIYVH